MSKKILLAYTTAAGSTAEVAEAIAKEIADPGSDQTEAAVDVLRTEDVTDVGDYGAIIVGSGIRAGKVYRDTLSFLERFQEELSQVPVAYFVVCMTAMDPTEESRREVETYVDQMRESAPQVTPVNVGKFGGVMDYKTLPFVLRLIVKWKKAPEGDFRDWDAIRAWAADVRRALLMT